MRSENKEMFIGASRKRQRAGSNGRLSSHTDSTTTTTNTELKSEEQIPIPSPTTLSLRRLTATIPGGFNDPTTADILLRLHLAGSPDSSDHLPSLDLHLHSSTIRRSRYFSARLSGRWLHPDLSSDDSSSSHLLRLTLSIQNPSNFRRPFDPHVAVLHLLYTLDFAGEILSVADALEILPVALELLFDDCIRACLRFIEAVPWTEEEEEHVLNLIPFLKQEESVDLISRLFPTPATADDGKKNVSEEMLYGLILKVMHSNPGWASVKAFMAKLMRDYSSRDSVKRVLDRAFMESLGMVKELLGEYASPDFRVSGDNDETEAIQRLKIHTAKVNVRNLLWLVDRMLELKVADTAAKEWSDQSTLAADLQKTFKEDTWRNIAPGLPTLVLRCTSRLANAVAAGSILAPRQVRMEFVKQWLPVLNCCREIVCGTPSEVYQDLEETFLQIISTLPISDAQHLLQDCLCFSTRNVDDCPHLALAFTTWFRRANRVHPNDSSTS